MQFFDLTNDIDVNVEPMKNNDVLVYELGNTVFIEIKRAEQE